MWVLQIVFIIANLILAYILHNSEYIGYYGNVQPEPFKMQLFKWLIWLIFILTPFANILSFIVMGAWMCVDWSDDHRVKTDDNSILLKKY